MEFKRKKVIITGANRSMGQDMAIAFASQGADIAISYRSDKTGAEKTIQAVEKSGQRAQAFYADFSDMDNVTTFAKQAIDFLDGVDILINNAGIIMRESLLDLSPKKMQQVFQINTIAPLYLTQCCALNMIEKQSRGCIINISSISSCLVIPKRIGYAASKAAMNKWTQHASLDLAEYGIRVNTVAPGVVASGMNQDMPETDPARWAQLQANIPLGRTGVPDDITQMALFLASEEKASWITGQTFIVDGGRVLC